MEHHGDNYQTALRHDYVAARERSADLQHVALTEEAGFRRLGGILAASMPEPLRARLFEARERFRDSHGNYCGARMEEGELEGELFHHGEDFPGA